MAAVMALGAEGVQIGTRFALTEESSAHPNFKNLCLNLNEGDTQLVLKKLAPTRLAKSNFLNKIRSAEDAGASADHLKEILGKGRAKKGIFEGDLQEGEMEIGQIAALFHESQSATEIIQEIITDYRNTVITLKQDLF